MAIILEDLLTEAVSQGASDLLLVPGAPPTIRVDGDLTYLAPDFGQLGPQDAASMLSPYLSPGEKRSEPSDAAADFCFEQRDIGRFRCNMHRTRDGVAASLRLLPATIPDLGSLNLPPQVARLATLKRGFCLVVGPSGAGKSTTLASLVDEINRNRACHIVTIEDPVEYLHTHRRGLVEQIEIGEDSPSFSEALRHALRQDPDVILVGEMRDLDTISIALTAAETGHLVLSSLHTNDTSHAVERIIDVFPGAQQGQVRQQLAMSLSGVLAQHLIPRADGPGRIPAMEVLLATGAIRSLIRSSKTHQIYSMIGTSKAQGLQSLEDSLAGLVRKGTIDRETALAHANHRDELESILG